MLQWKVISFQADFLKTLCLCMCMHVCVCVCVSVRDTERDGEISVSIIILTESPDLSSPETSAISPSFGLLAKGHND